MIAVDWSRYRKCDACGADLAAPCRSLSGFVPGAQGGVVEVQADSPHDGRELRVGYARSPRSDNQDGGS